MRVFTCGTGLVKRTFGLALFALPVVYISMLLSTAVHEILGHGACAALLGGDFSGFVLRWDGMGWASCDLPASAPLSHEVLHLASGIVAEITCGMALWGLVSFFRRRPDVQVVLLVGSFICLTDGASYLLWNAYHAVPPGDVGRIIWLASTTWPPDTPALRWVLLVTGALLFVGTMLYFYPAVFMRIEALILCGRPLVGGTRLLALLVFLVLPDSIGWFVFDWNQLAPGIGRLPCVVGALSAIAMAGLLFWYRPRLKEVGSGHSISRRHVIASWTCLAVTVLALALWFNEGINWGSKEETSRPRIIGPFAVGGSGHFLFCGVEKDNAHQYYMLVPLTDDLREPMVLSFPGSDRCLGAMWRPQADPDELLFVTSGEMQTITRLRVSKAGVEEISSYPVDPNLLVTVQSDWWSPRRGVLGLRVVKREKGVFSGAYVGFSKDQGKTIHVSTIPAPSQLLWVDDAAFYMTHVVEADPTTESEVEMAGMPVKTYEAFMMEVSKVELNGDRMTATTHQVLQGNNIVLATGSLKGSLLYARDDTLFRDGEVFAVLPEKIGRPMIDGDYLAVASADKKRVYILDGTGEIVDAKETPNGSFCIGVSAANKSIYWTASSPEDRTSVYTYNFVEKRESVVFEAR